MDEIGRNAIQYRHLSPDEVLEHLRYWISGDYWTSSFYLILCPARITVPVKKQTHKTKSPELHFLLRSGTIGRDNLNELHNTLQTAQFRTRRRLSTKLRLTTSITVVVPSDIPDFESHCIELLTLIAKQFGFGWPTTIDAEYVKGTSAPATLPGEFVQSEYYDELARKEARAFWEVILWTTLCALLAVFVYTTF